MYLNGNEKIRESYWKKNKDNKRKKEKGKKDHLNKNFKKSKKIT
jgi:hypothetical protein